MLEDKQLFAIPTLGFHCDELERGIRCSVFFAGQPTPQVPPAFGDKPCFEVVPALFSQLFWIASDAGACLRPGSLDSGICLFTYCTRAMQNTKLTDRRKRWRCL
jgi:hypothetical protein